MESEKYINKNDNNKVGYIKENEDKKEIKDDENENKINKENDELISENEIIIQYKIDNIENIKKTNIWHKFCV